MKEGESIPQQEIAALKVEIYGKPKPVSEAFISIAKRAYGKNEELKKGTFFDRVIAPLKTAKTNKEMMGLLEGIVLNHPDLSTADFDELKKSVDELGNKELKERIGRVDNYFLLADKIAKDNSYADLFKQFQIYLLDPDTMTLKFEDTLDKKEKPLFDDIMGMTNNFDALKKMSLIEKRKFSNMFTAGRLMNYPRNNLNLWMHMAEIDLYKIEDKK